MKSNDPDELAEAALIAWSAGLRRLANRLETRRMLLRLRPRQPVPR